MTEENLVRFLQYAQDISPSWLMTGTGPMLAGEPGRYPQGTGGNYAVSDFRAEYEVAASGGESAVSRIPLYDLEAEGGLTALFAGERTIVPQSYLSLPGLPHCDGAVYVRGDAMHPLINSGDIVLYKQVKDFERDIFWGEIYLISFDLDDEQFLSLRYIRASEREGYIALSGYNPHYGTQEISLERVRALALVKASVRFNTMK